MRDLRFVILVVVATVALGSGVLTHLQSHVPVPQEADTTPREALEAINGAEVDLATLPIMSKGELAGLLLAETLTWVPGKPIRLEKVKLYQYSGRNIVGYVQADEGIIAGTMESMEEIKLSGNVRMQRYLTKETGSE